MKMTKIGSHEAMIEMTTKEEMRGAELACIESLLQFLPMSERNVALLHSRRTVAILRRLLSDRVLALALGAEPMEELGATETHSS